MKPTARKFCGCIKSVRKTIKARPGKASLSRRAEQGAIAVCVKSVLQTRGRTMKKFKCGRKGYLKTQKMHRGGEHGVFGWASVAALVADMSRAIERQPHKKDDFVREAYKQLTTHGDIPAVTDATRANYERAVAAAAPYPELQDLIKSMEEGSAGVRRGPMAALRSMRRKEGISTM